MNRKRLGLVEIIKQIYYFSHLFQISNFFVASDHLCERHLAYSDHASPSCVGDVGSFQVVVELGEAWSIGQPRSLRKDAEKDLILFWLIGLVYFYFASEYVDALSGAGDLVFIEGVEEA